MFKGILEDFLIDRFADITFIRPFQILFCISMLKVGPLWCGSSPEQFQTEPHQMAFTIEALLAWVTKEPERFSTYEGEAAF